MEATNRTGSDLCQEHPEEKLRFVCTACDRLICRDCKMTEHEGHKTIDVAKANAGLEEKLENHKDRLKQRQTLLENVAMEVEEDRATATRLGHQVDKDIQQRIAIVTGWLQQVEAEAMDALRTTNIKIEASFTSTTTDLDKRREVLAGMVDEVSAMIRDMGDTGHNSSPAAALRLEQDMRCGRGCGEKLERLTEVLPNYSVRPYLRSDKRNLAIDAIRMFVGVPVFAQVSKMNPKVALSPVFRCTSVADARVTALCPMHDGTVWVAHDVISGEDLEQCVALYSSKGKALREQKVHGRVSIVRVAREWVLVGGEHVQKVMNMYETRDIVTERPDEPHGKKGESLPKQVQQADTHGPFSKLDVRFSIKSSAGGERSMCAIEARNLPLLWIVCTSSYPIRTQQALAMDADSSGQFFAVITTETVVRMYKISYPDPVGLYNGPGGAEFSPSDVCFHILEGKEVLLVADCPNNAIHVLDVNNKFRFIGFLGAGCPLLVQPTALCTDEHDRLWIGCKGGQLLTCLSAEKVQDDSSEEEDIERVLHV